MAHLVLCINLWCILSIYVPLHVVMGKFEFRASLNEFVGRICVRPFSISHLYILASLVRSYQSLPVIICEIDIGVLNNQL